MNQLAARGYTSRDFLRATGLQPVSTSPYNWIVCATNDPPANVTRFESLVAVPPQPPSGSRNNQTIYLFIGIQNNNAIIQPVLQWGSPFGAQAGWYIQGWFVNEGQRSYTSAVPIEPGNPLRMVIEGTATPNPGLFNYTCRFEDPNGQVYQDTVLPPQTVAQLTQCAVALEAYDIESCSDYPNTDRTTFGSLSIQTTPGGAASPWQRADLITGCGQHAVVIVDSIAGGQIDFCYR